MTTVQVTQELQSQVQQAMANPYRFERCERFAMSEVLRAWSQHAPAARVFVDTARNALGEPKGTRRLRSVQEPRRVSAAA